MKKKCVMLCFCRWLRWNALQNWMYSAQMVLQPLILLGILRLSLQKRGEWLVVLDQWVNHVLILKTLQSINQGRKKKILGSLQVVIMCVAWEHLVCLSPLPHALPPHLLWRWHGVSQLQTLKLRTTIYITLLNRAIVTITREIRN